MAVVTDKVPAFGTVAAQPTSGSVTFQAREVEYPFFKFDFTFDAAAIPVTDAARSGSSGSLKLFDFNQGVIHIISSRQNYTAVSESAGVSGGDTVFDIGLGSVAIAAAADGVLSGAATYDDIGAKVDGTLVTGALSGGTAITTIDPANVSIDGTATAADIVLNWSGTAATVDANGTVYVTGTATIVGCYVGDD